MNNRTLLQSAEAKAKALFLCPKGGEKVPEKFTITDTVSTADWGDVDKSRIWRLLKQGLEEGAEGTAAAVREIYAVVKATVNKDLTQADTWGPHHEVRDDGRIIINRARSNCSSCSIGGSQERTEPDTATKAPGSKTPVKAL